MNIDIITIKDRLDLLKKANLQDSVLVKDLAKEINVRVTDLMQFILNNPKLFSTKEIWSLKRKTSYYYVCGKKYKDTKLVRDKLKGLGISEAYLRAEDNFRTDEWLEKQKREYRKTIWVSKWDNYGTIEGEYINGETDDSEYRYHLWRNTHEKIDKLRDMGVLFETSFFIGGFGDCSEHKCDTAINSNGKKKLEEDGWTVIC